MKIFTLLLLSWNLFFDSAWAVTATDKGISNLPFSLQAEAKKIQKDFQSYLNSKGEYDNLNLNLEEGMRVSVYNKPGIYTDEQCAADQKKFQDRPEDQCQKVGRPTNQAKTVATGSLDVRPEKDADGNQVLRSYIEVAFSYDDGAEKKVGTGWIPAAFASYKPTTPLYSEIKVEAPIAKAPAKAPEKSFSFTDWLKAICSGLAKNRPSAPTATAKNNLKDITDVSKALQKKVDDSNRERKTVADIADALSSKVGICTLKPPTKAPRPSADSLIYDEFALPTVKKTSLPKNVVGENGPMTPQNLVDIDAMSRTLFAEMNGCPVEYMMAVARIMVNRADAMEQDPKLISTYVNNPDQHDASKTLLCKAVTSPVQFTPWNETKIDSDALAEAREAEALRLQSLMKKPTNKKAEAKQAQKAADQAYQTIKPDAKSGKFYEKNDSGMLQTLCPPSNPAEISYRGKVPDDGENAAWQNVLKIATQAVLFPKQFNERTANLKGITNFTSNHSSFYNYKLVHRSIEGHDLNDSRCLNLWVNSK